MSQSRRGLTEKNGCSNLSAQSGIFRWKAHQGTVSGPRDAVRPRLDSHDASRLIHILTPQVITHNPRLALYLKTGNGGACSHDQGLLWDFAPSMSRLVFRKPKDQLPGHDARFLFDNDGNLPRIQAVKVRPCTRRQAWQVKTMCALAGPEGNPRSGMSRQRIAPWPHGSLTSPSGSEHLM